MVEYALLMDGDTHHRASEPKSVMMAGKPGARKESFVMTVLLGILVTRELSKDPMEKW
jgi:hypothetical protein